MTKIKGIKKAVSYINANRDMYHNVILNTKTGVLHVDSFVDGNSYTDYANSSSFVCIGSYTSEFLKPDNITMRDIKRMLSDRGYQQ